jgi:hypothetical protein
MSATLGFEKSQILKKLDLEKSKTFGNSICGIGSTAGCFFWC